MNKLKEFLRKFWFIVWKDDSPKGWIISLIFIFIVIKFIFFPLLNLVTGTALPLVVVESCSMYHSGNLLTDFDEWWESNGQKYSSFGIDKEEFQKYRLNNGFNKGDIIFSIGADIENLEPGDIIIFSANQPRPIIHRVMTINEDLLTFSTFGDNNNGQLVSEKVIQENQIIGKAILKIPYIGWVKLLPVNIITGQGLSLCS
jgi:signal peptidase I